MALAALRSIGRDRVWVYQPCGFQKYSSVNTASFELANALLNALWLERASRDAIRIDRATEFSDRRGRPVVCFGTRIHGNPAAWAVLLRHRHTMRRAGQVAPEADGLRLAHDVR